LPPRIAGNIEPGRIKPLRNTTMTKLANDTLPDDLDAEMGFAAPHDVPVPYMYRTRTYYQALGHERPYRWAQFVDVPFTALKKMLARELEWVRQNPKARQAKSKARMQRFEELQSREFQERNETNEIYIPPGPRLGELVIEAKGLSKAYGEKLLFDNLNFNLPQGGIVGIIGPNGAGKTTLFRIITGQETADGGEIRIGPSVQLAYVDQSRQSLDDKKTVWQEISNGLDLLKVGNYETPSRAYVGRFNFRGSQQQQLIGELSGGERNRVHLAKVLKEGGNVILLDEPTNDLDVETLRALEEALLEFPGSAIVISHDRWFLDRIATHILAFEGDSQVVWFEGNYEAYEADRKARLGEEADQPHRIKYKKLAA
jgi:ATPase subunit of ABC transporter with duplicated ATPase domains